jgi:type II secretory pathway pseudopilin PulG
MPNCRRRTAFSLGEVIVALAIIAVVSAVLLPTIVGQINKADPQQVVQGALAVRGAVEQFHGDVRRYPLDFSDLISRPVDGDVGLTGGKYAAPERLRWAGPYLQKDAAAAVKTGYDLSFDPTFRVVNVGPIGLSNVVTDPPFLTLCLAADSVKALAIDQMLDDGVLSTGIVRWTQNVAGATDTLKYFVAPIQ